MHNNNYYQLREVPQKFGHHVLTCCYGQRAPFPVATCWPMIGNKVHKIVGDMTGERRLLILLPI